MNASGPIDEAVFAQAMKDSRKADREDKALADALRPMVNSAGWRMYVEQILEKRIQALGALLLEPSGSQDGAWKAEFLKGALYGLCLTRDLPGIIVSSMNDASREGDPDAQ